MKNNVQLEGLVLGLIIVAVLAVALVAAFALINKKRSPNRSGGALEKQQSFGVGGEGKNFLSVFADKSDSVTYQKS